MPLQQRQVRLALHNCPVSQALLLRDETVVRSPAQGPSLRDAALRAPPMPILTQN